jgi:hypothetical protein
VETSTGLLLYTENGFLPAITLILTIEMAALAFGLWGGSFPLGGGAVEQIRRGWLFSLVVFALAAALSAGMDFLGDGSGTRVSQGFGLGFLGGLPLFAIGSLLGAMGRAGQQGRSLELPTLGAATLSGAAAGFLTAGLLLIPNAAPYSIYLFALVVLSGGALVQGWVLDGWPLREVLEVISGPTGEWRAEGRALGSARREVKVLLAEGRIRGAEDLTGSPVRPWERSLLEGLSVVGDQGPESILYLGGGSGTLSRGLSRVEAPFPVLAVERSPELVTLAESTFGRRDEDEMDEEAPVEGGGIRRSGLRIGELLEGQVPDQTRALVVVDCDALPRLTPSPFLREGDWRFLAQAAGPEGALVLGGIGFSKDRSDGVMEAFAERAREWFDDVTVYRAMDHLLDTVLLPEMGEEQYVVVCKTSREQIWTLILPGFEALPMAEG